MFCKLPVYFALILIDYAINEMLVINPIDHIEKKKEYIRMLADNNQPNQLKFIFCSLKFKRFMFILFAPILLYFRKKEAKKNSYFEIVNFSKKKKKAEKNRRSIIIILS